MMKRTWFNYFIYLFKQCSFHHPALVRQEFFHHSSFWLGKNSFIIPASG